MIRKIIDYLAFIALIVTGVFWATTAFEQANNQFGNTWYTPGNQSVGGSMMMCLSGANTAVPCLQTSSSASLPVSLINQYPNSSIPITGNAAGSTSAVVGTLTANATRFTYICGFNVSAIGGTAESGPITVAGITGSSQVYQVPANATGGQVLVSQTFNPCIPSSAVNTAITVTTTANGTATAVDVNSWGYQL